MTESTDYKNRFSFHLIHFDGKKGQEITKLNFYVPLKEFGNADLSVENSTQIVDGFNEITQIFQDYMRRITVDAVYKQNETGEKNHQQDSNSRYIFKLIDHEAAIRENGSLSKTGKEVRVLYEKEIYANDFFAVQPLSIIPIWKDKDGFTGIRTILKETLGFNKYTNRFKKEFYPQNSFSVNSYETSSNVL